MKRALCILLFCGFVYAVWIQLCSIQAAKPVENPAREAVYNALNHLDQISKKKYGLESIGTSVAMPDGVIKRFGLIYELRKGALSRNECRKLFINLVNDYLTFINSDPDIQPYLETRPVTLDNIDPRIHISDPKGYPIAPPNIGAVQIFQGKFEYLVFKGKTIQEIETFVETYEEALDRVSKEP